MFKIGTVVLGVGLIILWLVGLSDHATGWLTWLNGIVGLVSLAAALSMPQDVSNVSASMGPYALAVGLFVFWIIGLATGATRWLTWWTFAFGCAYVLAGVATGTSERIIPQQRTPTSV
jgi:hypothetical protein